MRTGDRGVKAGAHGAHYLAIVRAVLTLRMDKGTYSPLTAKIPAALRQ
jgi:hypothetical protein